MDTTRLGSQSQIADNLEYKSLMGIIEGTRAGTWMWNVQTGETRFNERWAEIVGYSLAELQPLSIDTWVRLTHPDDLKKSNEALQQHFEGQTGFYECDARMKHKSGNWVWIQDRGKVVSWTEDRKPLWMAGSHIEVTEAREMQALKDEALGQLQAIAKNISGVLYQYVQRPDGSAYYAYVSDQLTDVFGCDPVMAKTDASSVWGTLYAIDLPDVAAAVRNSSENLSVFHQKFRIQHPTKGLRWIEAKSTPVVAPGGEMVWHGYSQDITEQQDNDEYLRVAANVFTHSSEAIFIANSELQITYSNEASAHITGYPLSDLRGKLLGFLAIDNADGVLAASLEQLKANGHWQGELMCRHKDGAAYVALASISAVKNTHGEITHYVAILSDISNIKQTQEELIRYANYDVLTDLPNRRLLQDRLGQALRRAHRIDGELAIGMLDIDGFKQVNDTHGHDAGDQLLREVAQRLKNAIRSDDTVARLGGDEFAFVLSEVDAGAVFDRILQAVCVPVHIAMGVVVKVSASIGVSYLRSRSVAGDQLLREADQAMYAAKRSGKNKVSIFEQVCNG